MKVIVLRNIAAFLVIFCLEAMCRVNWKVFESRR